MKLWGCSLQHYLGQQKKLSTPKISTGDKQENYTVIGDTAFKKNELGWYTLRWKDDQESLQAEIQVVEDSLYTIGHHDQSGPCPDAHV